jgi:hypothetical protein
VPIVDVESILAFAVKVGGTVVLVNAIGAAMYLVRRPRRPAAELPPAELRRG